MSRVRLLRQLCGSAVALAAATPQLPQRTHTVTGDDAVPRQPVDLTRLKECSTSNCRGGLPRQHQEPQPTLVCRHTCAQTPGCAATASPNATMPRGDRPEEQQVSS